ncbi:MAG: efflux RND transporter periplasmic adaptor subunit [Elusimicrobiota bacterium]
MTTRKKVFLFIGIFVALIVGFRAFRAFHAKPVKIEYLLPVKVSKLAVKDLEELINLTGDVRGVSEAKVYSSVPGKLLEKKKDIGDIVYKNDVIAMVDRDEPALEFKASEVKSPLDGVITHYFLDVGEAVSPQTPVFEVATVDRVKIVTNISEKDIPKVKKGLRVRFSVDAYPENTFPGTVSKIGQSIDLQSRTAQVEIAVSNENSLLKPGMFAKLEIIVSVRTGCLTLPADAVGESDAQRYVYIIKDFIAYKKIIKTGVSQGPYIQVLEGISAADDVAVLGWQNLREGMKVEVVE